jgi:hypothetical protein
VFCSHTIEHVDDPIRFFIVELRRRAKGWTVVYAPLDERPLGQHRFTVTRDYVAGFGPVSVDTWIRPGWKKGACVLFVLQGDD